MNYSIKREAGGPRYHTGQDIDQPAAEDNGLTFTGRIASWSARHRWWVIAASVLVLVMAMFVSSAVETKLLDDNSMAEGDSGKAIRLLDERFDDGGAPTEQLVFSNPSLDVDNTAYRATVEELVQELSHGLGQSA